VAALTAVAGNHVTLAMLLTMTEGSALPGNELKNRSLARVRGVAPQVAGGRDDRGLVA
jgi:hypothetical protein